MKTNYKKKSLIKYAGFLFLLTAAMNGFSQLQVSVQASIVAPVWAPAYENVSQVQYYYLPDLEVYYDVWHHEFVYLENGSWVFSTVLPQIYGNYDLYGGHVVILDYRIHQPWMHHELYSGHYPKYYHHSVGMGNRGEYSTGFNENTNQHYYGARTNAAPIRNEEHERRSEAEHSNPHESRREAVHYQEKNVGQPVRVQKNMMRPKDNRESGGEHRR